MTGQILLAWLKLLALDGDLARAEPGRVPHTAARLVGGGRRPPPPPEKSRRPGHGPRPSPPAQQRIDALPQAP